MSRIEESGATVVGERRRAERERVVERAVWPLAAASTSAAEAATSTSAASKRAPGGTRTAAGRCACVGAAARDATSDAPTRAVRVVRAARRAMRACMQDDRGAATAEYAIATMAAVAFAGLLVVILQSDEVRGMLLDLVRRALTYDR